MITGQAKKIRYAATKPFFKSPGNPLGIGSSGRA